MNNLTETEQLNLRQWALEMSLLHGYKLFPTSGDSWASVPEPNTIVDNAYKLYDFVKERWGEKFIDPPGNEFGLSFNDQKKLLQQVIDNHSKDNNVCETSLPSLEEREKMSREDRFNLLASQCVPH